jgi:hypothetical protein
VDPLLQEILLLRRDNPEAVAALGQQVALLVATDFLSLGCPHHMVHLAQHLVDGLLVVAAADRLRLPSAVDQAELVVAVKAETLIMD